MSPSPQKSGQTIQKTLAKLWWTLMQELLELLELEHGKHRYYPGWQAAVACWNGGVPVRL